MSAIPDPIQLELFINRFRAVVEEMGTLLQRTAFSVNVKERFDFSCGLLNGRGELVVNAPHIPVHLGGLGVCGRAVAEELPLEDGDVALTNHPAFGGSHLPDISLIAPVFYAGKRIGFVINRAHHAELGGKRPGSMPPDALNLAEEGVVVPPMYLVLKGKAQWTKIRKHLLSGPFPTRSINENLADINAALASLMAGKRALQNLCTQFGPETVSYYMEALYHHAAARIAQRFTDLGQGSRSATEFLDDGHRICVRIGLIVDEGRPLLEVDFAGTSAVHPANFNATPAIIHSALMYVLRLLLDEPLPLNEGLLRDVKLLLPPSFLNPLFPEDPAQCPAVVAGNTETSQRVVDTLLKAFGVAGCSQGTMNNLLFGDETFGYYETIGGGAGATPGAHGASGVQVHMTNTHMTDPEVMELRYPVRVHEWALRSGSGGNGRRKGGDGLIRELAFLKPLSVTFIGQHRNEKPYGVHGGASGASGIQTLIRTDGTRTLLPGVATVEVQAGDVLRVETPGGGGWGPPIQD